MLRDVIMALVLVILWGVFTHLNVDSLLIAIPFVLLAGFLFHHLKPNQKDTIHIRTLPKFIFWFIAHSLYGGIDVSRRVLSPSLPLRLGFVEYSMHLQPGTARTFFINCISLLPGTLSVSVKGSVLLLHALDTRESVTEQTFETEVQIARLFGIRLQDNKHEY
jgi:multicomponent Na+:H+ antiporter subunit E